MPAPVRLPLTTEQRRAARAVIRAHQKLMTLREQRDTAVAYAVNVAGIAATHLADEIEAQAPGRGLSRANVTKIAAAARGPRDRTITEAERQDIENRIRATKARTARLEARLDKVNSQRSAQRPAAQ